MSVDFEIKDNYDINDFLRLVTVLRSPGGCPWDRKQTHESIKKNFIEETYEVVEAINKADAEGLKEELGDVLLQVAMHSEMESEKGSFDFNDVVNDICKKLVVRHPHVFEFPALMRAQKVQEKAAKAGFDWDDINGAVDKLHEEIDELETALAAGVGKDIEEEFGDVLFSCVNVSRFIGADSEEALTASTDKFIKRYLLVEKLAADEGLDMKTASIEELDKLWNKAKIIIAEKAKTEEFK